VPRKGFTPAICDLDPIAVVTPGSIELAEARVTVPFQGLVVARLPS
jgi:hypothetical protein